MNVTVTSRSKELDPAAKEYASDRVNRVLRVFDRLEAAQIILDQERGDHIIEAIVTAPRGARFVAHSRNKDLRTGIDAMCQKLESQVRNWKDRLVEHRPAGSNEDPESPT